MNSKAEAPYPWHWLLLCLSWFLFVSYQFLLQQSIWTDETTQMSGLTLGPIEVVYWLLGKGNDFGVPIDRMPPVSYWLGQLWSKLFGLTEHSMRLFSLSAASLALCLTFHTTYRAFGQFPALVAGLLFATSPNLIVISVEIRAYALFLLWSVAALWFFWKIVDEKAFLISSYVGVAGFCLLAIYTHFYGLIFTAVLFIALSISLVKSHRSLLPLLITALATALLSLGVIPFILESLAHPNTLIQKSVLKDLFRLLYRQMFHASILSSFAVICSLFGISGLVALAITAARSPFRNALFHLLLIGFILVGILDQAMRAFEAASPIYNIWMLPIVCRLLSSGVTWQEQSRRIASFTAVLLTLVGPLYGDYMLINKGSYFSHGRYEEIYKRLQSLSPDLSIIYPGGEVYGMPYFALYYLSNGTLHQYQQPSNLLQLHRLLKKGYGEAIPLDRLNSRYLVVIQGSDLSNAELQEEVSRKDPLPLPPAPLVHDLSKAAHWKLIENETLPAFRKLQIFIFEQQ